jgi:hypothetical protein
LPSESIFILVVSDDGGIFVDIDDDADEDNNGTCAFPLIFVFSI